MIRALSDSLSRPHNALIRTITKGNHNCDC